MVNFAEWNKGGPSGALMHLGIVTRVPDNVNTPTGTAYVGCPELKLVWHGCSGSADCENTNFKTIGPVPSEILRS